MTVNWRVKSHKSRLFQREFDLVRLVMPQVIHSEALFVMEILLGSVITGEVSWSVQGSGQLFVVASQSLRECLLVCFTDLLRAYEKLVVCAPMPFSLSIWWSLLEQPDSEVGSWLQT